ncbi:actin-histidine N-methyltransferase isoform X2 [Folsomia candida]|uniref:actin-histidine N-methyltransferase isoform X2 n=1 Tax=Folsomia candida TaxID=158441 RepID=UPI0016055A3B|nr:actin-histidine N-methyltransferase isoform X2 [Folsomia candida]
MSNKKVPLHVHVEALLNEASQQMPVGLNLEWEHYCKLEGLIAKIKEREAYRDGNLNNSSSIDDVKQLMIADNERRKERFPTFFEWLHLNDINPDKVEISYNDAQGFGLKTKVPLDTNDVVFDIPRKAIITSAVARESKLKILIDKDPLLSVMQNVLLAVYLVYERFSNPNSHWKAYIDILPRMFDTVVYFTKEEMTVLKHSPCAFREALRMLRNVARQYVSILQLTFTSNFEYFYMHISLNSWGVSAVTTRINHLPSPTGEPILSLIPLWDLCNHEESEQICTDYNEDKQTLICYAGHEYKTNSDFNIFYGKRSSVDFLVHNGFVPPNYRHDSYSLELGVGVNDPNYSRKKTILAKLGLECQNTFAVKPDQLATATKLFAFIRVFQADEGALTEIEEGIDNLSSLGQPTKACWKYLAMRFTLLRKATENSLASTLKTLYGDNSTDLPRVTMILLQLLKNEQKVLEMLAHCAESLVVCTPMSAMTIQENSKEAMDSK